MNIRKNDNGDIIHISNGIDDANLTSLGWVINWGWRDNCHMRDNTILGDVDPDTVIGWLR